jgi:hypothetical protein
MGRFALSHHKLCVKVGYRCRQLSDGSDAGDGILPGLVFEPDPGLGTKARIETVGEYWYHSGCDTAEGARVWVRQETVVMQATYSWLL